MRTRSLKKGMVNFCQGIYGLLYPVGLTSQALYLVGFARGSVGRFSADGLSDTTIYVGLFWE